MLPVEKQMIWAWGYYEQRETYLPAELKAWRPLWINGEFLKKAILKKGRLYAGDLSFSSLYIDAKYMDIESLRRVAELAGQGFPVCLKQIPLEPGLHKSKSEYKLLVGKLSNFGNVKSSWNQMTKIAPLITGTEKFDYWCRSTDEGLTFFFANPKSTHLTFPLEYGQSLNDRTEIYPVQIFHKGSRIPVSLIFKPYQSLLLKINKLNRISFIDVTFEPKIPVYNPRIRKGKEPWEV